MKRRIISLLLTVALLFTMLPSVSIVANAATQLSASPYPEVEYGYTAETQVGTIRYIAQNRSSEYFSWNYWPSYSFGGYTGGPEKECGTACISMALSYVGVDRTPKVLLESTNGYTGSMWTQQGDATSKSITISASKISEAMDDYINGRGKYSPLAIYIVPFSATSDMHWVLLVGKIDDNKYLALNPWHTSGTSGTFTIQINGSSATYNGITNPITAVKQWYNPNASICTHTYKDCGVCSKCSCIYEWESTFTDSVMGKYVILDDFTPRTDKPYDAASKANLCMVPGAVVDVYGSYTNAYGSKWYKFKANGETYYGYDEYFEFSEYFEQEITCTVTSPAEGEVVPKAAYPVIGTVTSKYPLQKVEAYIDGEWYATVVLGNAKTLNLRNSAINYDLDFSALEPGSHRLVIKAYDIHRSSFEIICERRFTTEGTTACSHSYSGSITQLATCGSNGTKTYTCSKCSSSYTEQVPATGNHSYSCVVSTPATCGDTGIRTYTCSGCGDSYTETIPATGHSHGDWGLVEVDGLLVYRRYCSNCPHYQQAPGNSVTLIYGNGTASETFAVELGTYYTIPADAIPERLGYNFAGWQADDGTTFQPGESLTYNGNVILEAVWIGWEKTEPVMIAGGTCGLNITWELDDEGTLTISGTGAMSDYQIGGPWSGYKDEITKVIVSEGVTSIGETAFFDCSNITSVVFPSSLELLGECAFLCCESLTSVVIPEGVTTIGNGAFSMCYNLETVVLPLSITSVEITAFDDCTALTDVYYAGTATQWARISIESRNACLTGAAIHYTTAVIDAGRYPESSHNYTNDTDETENFTWQGAEKLTIIFSPSTDTELSYDFIYLYDGAGNQLGKYTGKELSGKTLTLFGDSFSIRLTSDGSVQRYGYSFSAILAHMPSTYSGTCGDNLTWTLDDEGTLTISGTGAMANYEYCGSPWYNDTSIKALVIEDGVTTIGDNAFFLCVNMTSVTIPDSVTYIGCSPFSYCDLTGIWVDENNPSYSSDDRGVLFNKDKTVLIKFPEKIFGSYTIPDSVTNIYLESFMASHLTNITIPKNVTDIGDYAFHNCKNLTEVYYGGTAAQWAAITISSGNEYLTNATIHTVEPVLTGITVKTQPTKTEYWIGEALDTTGLTLTATYSDGSTADITEGFTVSGFDGTTAGTKTVTVTYEGFTATFNVIVRLGGTCGENLTWTLDDTGTLTISGTGAMTNYTSTSKSPWYDNSDIKKIVISNGVTSVGSDAFLYCDGVTDISFGNSVAGIGTWSFYNCTGLTEITLPNNVADIGSHAFQGCTNLTSVTIPDSVTSIADCAFYNCTSLVDVYYGGTADQWAQITIGESNTDLRYANIYFMGEEREGTCGDNLTWTLDDKGTLTISGTGNMEDYDQGTSPWNEIKISIKEVIVEDGVTSIGSNAFYYCDKLESVSISGSVTSIGANAFENCYILTDVRIENGVSTIGNNAFSGTCLESIVIPDSVIALGEAAFAWCTHLKSVSLPVGLAEIKTEMFSNCSELTSITLPAGITSIGAAAFQFSGLTSIVIPDAVTIIDAAVFNNCYELESIRLPANLTEIRMNAFWGCESLESIILPDSLISIDEYAFGACSSLTSFTIPENVTDISAFALCGCSGLVSVTIPVSVTSIDYNAFTGCSSLTDVYYGGSSKQWDAIAIDMGNESLTNATIHTVEPVLTGIAVNTQPTKTEYWVGEELDTTGMVVTATYSDGSNETITEGFTAAGFDSTSTGMKTVTVTYEGFTDTFIVTVNEKAVDENAFQIVLESKKVTKGNEFTVTVEIKNNPGFSYLEVTPVFSSELTLVNVENGDLISDFTKGKQYVWVSDEDVTEDGVLLTFTFLMDDSVEPGNYQVSFNVRTCANYDEEFIEIAVVNAEIEVVDCVYGDATGDGVIDGLDVIRLKKYLANYDYDSASSTIAVSLGADANGDGKIDGLDVIRLKKYLANYDYEAGDSTVVLGPQ